jgi:1,4-alpha-glucan branching enzyme
MHQSTHTMVKELNHLYLQNRALWERDFDYTGFHWIDFSDTHNSVLAYLRKSEKQDLLCIHQFTPNYHANYHLKLPHVASLIPLFNTDHERYGGSGKGTRSPHIHADSIDIELPPLATLIFEIRYL